jgi:SAM-dependent methyltransferase
MKMVNCTVVKKIIMDKNIKKVFELYSNKTESDYWIIGSDGEKIPTQSTLLIEEDLGKYQVGEGYIVYKKEILDKLSPDNIDSREFWKIATDNFPLFSIAGGIQVLTTIEQVNEATTTLAYHLGCIDVLSKEFAKNKNLMMLEIGPGHGNIKNLLVKNNLGDNYYAIDVNPLFEHPRIYQTDGKNIPDTIPNPMDLVYSVNVFQHLSKNQRTSYYRQIFEVLKDGGVFVFGMFVLTEKNKDWPCWGARDEQGGFYCNFFKQFTKVDHIDELIFELKNIGFFSVEEISQIPDKTNYVTFKVIK